MRFLYDPTAPGCVRCAKTGRTYKQQPGKYMTLRMDDGTYDRAHRVVWVIHNGPIPEGKQVDHVNMDRADNRIENLRLADQGQQSMNREAYANNAAGIKGLHRWRGYWKGQVTSGGKVYTKVNKDREVVVAWLEETRAKLHGEFAR